MQVRINLRSPSVAIPPRCTETDKYLSKAIDEIPSPSAVMSAIVAEPGPYRQDQQSLASEITEAEPVPYVFVDVAGRTSVERVLNDMPRTPRAKAENPNVVRWCLEGECKGEDWCRKHLPDTSGLLRLPSQMVLPRLAMLACSCFVCCSPTRHARAPPSPAGDVGQQAPPRPGPPPPAAGASSSRAAS